MHGIVGGQHKMGFDVRFVLPWVPAILRCECMVTSPDIYVCRRSDKQCTIASKQRNKLAAMYLGVFHSVEIRFCDFVGSNVAVVVSICHVHGQWLIERVREGERDGERGWG